MALTISQLFTPVQLPASAAVLYTVPATPGTTVLKNGRVRLTNTTAGAVTATLYADAAASVSAAGNCFLSAVSIAAGASLDVDLPTMRAGDTLRGFAGSATSITMHEMAGILYS
jgi:hypothetical protein